MSITSYPTDLAVATEGLLSNCEFKTVDSYVNKETVAVSFGRLVVKSGDKGFVLPTVAGPGLAVGITAKSEFHDNRQVDGSVSGIPAKDVGNVMRNGRIWMQVEAAVNKGDAVFTRLSGGTQGLVRSGTGSGGLTTPGATHALVANAQFITSASANGFAEVELRGVIGLLT